MDYIIIILIVTDINHFDFLIVLCEKYIISKAQPEIKTICISYLLKSSITLSS